jgi:hypothetical protein
MIQALVPKNYRDIPSYNRNNRCKHIHKSINLAGVSSYVMLGFLVVLPAYFGFFFIGVRIFS